MSLRWMNSFWIVVLLLTAIAATASSQKTGSLPDVAGQGWSSGSEITVSGQIAEVSTTRAPGAPAGMNFVLNGTQHTLRVNAGTNLGEAMRNRLRTGVPVEVTGVIETFGGQSYLLAREMVVDGTLIPVRNANGIPVRPMGQAGPQTRSARSRVKGGAR